MHENAKIFGSTLVPWRWVNPICPLAVTWYTTITVIEYPFLEAIGLRRKSGIVFYDKCIRSVPGILIFFQLTTLNHVYDGWNLNFMQIAWNWGSTTRWFYESDIKKEKSITFFSSFFWPFFDRDFTSWVLGMTIFFSTYLVFPIFILAFISYFLFGLLFPFYILTLILF